MARQIYQYQPYNETPDKALGILLPFNKDAGGAKSVSSAYNTQATSGKGVFKSSYSTEQQALSNLKNLILTQKGERIFQPNFGTDIQKSLFENNTDQLVLQLQETLSEDIKFWLPYIIIKKLEVFQNIDQYQIAISLSFSTTETGANQEITIFASGENIFIQDENINVTEQSSAPISSVGGGY